MVQFRLLLGMHLVGHFCGLTGSQVGAFLYLQRHRRTVIVSAPAKDPMIAYKSILHNNFVSQILLFLCNFEKEKLTRMAKKTNKTFNFISPIKIQLCSIIEESNAFNESTSSGSVFIVEICLFKLVTSKMPMVNQ